MVATHGTVLAGKPFCASLSENDVSGDHVLLSALFGAETFAGGIASFCVGATLGVVGGVTDLQRREVIARE